MSARCLASGVLLGAGLAMLAAGLILQSYADRLSVESRSWTANLSKYVELLDSMEKLLNITFTSNVTATYTDLVRELPRLEAMLSEYRLLYGEVEKYKDLILQVYTVTHSRDYNNTIAELEAMAEDNTTIISLILGSFLRKTAEYMREAQKLSAEAVRIVEMIESNPPGKLQKYLDLAKAIAEEMPPEELNETLNAAKSLLSEAKQLIRNTSPSGAITDKASHYAKIAASAGIASIAAAVILLLASRKSGQEQENPD